MTAAERTATPELFGLSAEFPSAEALVHAADEARKAGYTRMDAYTPFPIEELDHALGMPRSKVPLLCFLGGAIGALSGFFLQYWTQVYTYPMNIGGRPHNSWPSFIVVTFEMTILFAALAAVIGMFALNKLPMPYHPMFHARGFERASRDGFFLCIEAEDPQFDREATTGFLQGLQASEVSEVES
jgi:hypothetical protein